MVPSSSPPRTSPSAEFAALAALPTTSTPSTANRAAARRKEEQQQPGRGRGASPSPHPLGAQQEGRCLPPGLTRVVAAPPSSDLAAAAVSILAPSFFRCRVDGCHGEDADGSRGCGFQFKARASGTEPAPTFRCELQLPKGEHVSSMAVIAKLPSFAGTAHISNSNCTFIYCCSHVASSVSFFLGQCNFLSRTLSFRRL
ncbi:uncharacterized protein [Aegilops tauschii subsp. strangulata]|uniref:uncharacterized protein isoform X2 n=1 Tax=Aegilops tauschii subsp. strangulata TaxID=200361 RepID=UPI00098AEEC6|nr:uncharacterized protein LOC109749691 isoform X2 [Aegilops tauschii subsp. strangulata]